MKNIPFSRSVESWHAYPYSTCRQVQISFLGMPQIAHFQVEKWKSSLPWEGGHPLPTPPSPRSVATLPRKDCAPQMFWLITPLLRITLKSTTVVPREPAIHDNGAEVTNSRR